jgi:Sulfotransferase domain
MACASDIKFLVIGAQKSATSWLYYCLQDHPEIALPLKKREVEYVGGPLYQQKGGIEWYVRLFEEADQNAIWGDVSVEYLWSEISASELSAHIPHSKFIISLRDPIARLKSAYLWYLRKNKIDSKVSLGDLLTQKFKKNLSSEYEVVVNDLLERGNYAVQLKRYLDKFSPEKFKIVFYEDIMRDPQRVLANIYEFVGVSNAFCPASITKRPKQNAYIKLLVDLERTYSRNKLLVRGVNLLNQHAAQFSDTRANKERFIGQLPLAGLKEYYSTKNSELSKLLGPLPGGNELQRKVGEYWI